MPPLRDRLPPSGAPLCRACCSYAYGPNHHAWCDVRGVWHHIACGRAWANIPEGTVITDAGALEYDAPVGGVPAWKVLAVLAAVAVAVVIGRVR